MAENQNNNVEFTSNKDQHLKRSLKARHMNMIALGGAIGTGLFVAGGEVVSTAGPWWCACSLRSHRYYGVLPHDISWGNGDVLADSWFLRDLCKTLCKPGLWFALGWNYWFNWAITLAAEVLAGHLS